MIPDTVQTIELITIPDPQHGAEGRLFCRKHKHFIEDGSTIRERLERLLRDASAIVKRMRSRALLLAEEKVKFYEDAVTSPTLLGVRQAALAKAQGHLNELQTRTTPVDPVDLHYARGDVDSASRAVVAYFGLREELQRALGALEKLRDRPLPPTDSPRNALASVGAETIMVYGIEIIALPWESAASGAHLMAQRWIDIVDLADHDSFQVFRLVLRSAPVEIGKTPTPVRQGLWDLLNKVPDLFAHSRYHTINNLQYMIVALENREPVDLEAVKKKRVALEIAEASVCPSGIAAKLAWLQRADFADAGIEVLEFTEVP
jgi:hypothetical protein